MRVPSGENVGSLGVPAPGSSTGEVMPRAASSRNSPVDVPRRRVAAITRRPSSERSKLCQGPGSPSRPIFRPERSIQTNPLTGSLPSR